MNTISIKYRPVSWLPFNRSTTGVFPEEYKQLSAGQFIAVIKLMNGAIAENNFISTMTGIPLRIVKKLAPFMQYNLIGLFTHFNADKPHDDFILKSISASGKTFVSPKERLKEMTFGQFIFVQSLYETWAESKTTGDLCRFIAALYIPSGKPFNEQLIDENQPFFEKVNPEIREAVAVNWKLVSDWLADAYPLVFMKTADVDVPVKKQFNGWLKIFDSIVGDNITETDRYAALPVNNVLRYMSAKIKENLKRKK
jgi:hypothetical protein